MARLAPIVKIATDGSRAGLPIKLRTHSLIMGPSGSGKTHLAKYLGEKLGLPVLVINIASWIITASRSEPWTWNHVVQWLSEVESGIIVIDECEKARSSSSSYEKFVVLELMALLDSTIPISIAMPRTGLWEDLPEEIQPSMDRGLLERKLRERVMTIGCGAWQSVWTEKSNTIGFASETEKMANLPSPKDILSGIDAEFRQRFRAEIEFLPPMKRDDYELVARKLFKVVPACARESWKKLVSTALDKGVAETLGMRIFEELLLDSMVLAQSQPQNPATCLEAKAEISDFLS